jgi:4-amino-4-deoxy-L-arabinose transferase-like glycosyltransferase
LCLPGGNISSIIRRSDDGGIGAVSFLRASLWKSWAFVACGAVSSWRWKFRRNIRSLVFLFFIVVVVFSFFTSVRGLESEYSLVLVGRIYPLDGIEAGFISFIKKN